MCNIDFFINNFHSCLVYRKVLNELYLLWAKTTFYFIKQDLVLDKLKRDLFNRSADEIYNLWPHAYVFDGFDDWGHRPKALLLLIKDEYFTNVQVIYKAAQHRLD